MPSKLNDFRMSLNTDIEPSTEFKSVLHKEDRDNIHTYVLANLKYLNIKPGGFVRFPKEKTKLKRTFLIQCDKNGKFKLIILPKTKLKDYDPAVPLEQIDKSKRKGGASKSGTVAFVSNERVNGKETQIFALTVSDPDIAQAKEEAHISAGMDSKHINKIVVGPMYEKNGVQKCIFFTEENAIGGTLSKFLMSLNEDELTKELQDKLILDLLLGIEEMHDRDLVHQDLKPDNLLVFKENNLKISDFGLTRLEGTGELWGASHYLSPEMILYFEQALDPKTNTKYNPVWYKENIIASEHESIPACVALTTDEGAHLRKTKADTKPNKANDMWAAGILIYQIMHNGASPDFTDPNVKKEIKDNPLLKKLLAFDRVNRADIKTAIAIHKGEYREAEHETHVTLHMGDGELPIHRKHVLPQRGVAAAIHPQSKPEHSCITWINLKTNHTWVERKRSSMEMDEQIISALMTKDAANAMLTACKEYDADAMLIESADKQNFRVILNVAAVEKAMKLTPEGLKNTLPKKP